MDRRSFFQASAALAAAAMFPPACDNVGPTLRRVFYPKVTAVRSREFVHVTNHLDRPVTVAMCFHGDGRWEWRVEDAAG